MLENINMVLKLKLLSKYSETLTTEKLLETDLNINKMISFFITKDYGIAINKLFDIVPEEKQISQETNYEFNNQILSKCLKIVNKEEDLHTSKIIQYYALLNEKIVEKEISKEMNKQKHSLCLKS